MKPDSPHDPDYRLRFIRIYLRQRLAITEFLAVFIVFPYILALSKVMPVILAFVIAASPIWFVLSANWALIEGRVDTISRGQVRRGLIAANILLGMVPFALLAAANPAPFDKWVLIIGIVLAVVALLYFRVRVRRFNERSSANLRPGQVTDA